MNVKVWMMSTAGWMLGVGGSKMCCYWISPHHKNL